MNYLFIFDYIFFWPLTTVVISASLYELFIVYYFIFIYVAHLHSLIMFV